MKVAGSHGMKYYPVMWRLQLNHEIRMPGCLLNNQDDAMERIRPVFFLVALGGNRWVPTANSFRSLPANLFRKFPQTWELLSTCKKDMDRLKQPPTKINYITKNSKTDFSYQKNVSLLLNPQQVPCWAMVCFQSKTRWVPEARYFEWS